MRNYEILAAAGTACRRTVADALSVLESQAAFGDDDTAQIRYCRRRRPDHGLHAARAALHRSLAAIGHSGAFREIGRCEANSAQLPTADTTMHLFITSAGCNKAILRYTPTASRTCFTLSRGWIMSKWRL